MIWNLRLDLSGNMLCLYWSSCTGHYITSSIHTFQNHILDVCSICIVSCRCCLRFYLYIVKNTNFLGQNKSCGCNFISFYFIRLFINHLSILLCPTSELDLINITSTLHIHSCLLFSFCLKLRLILKALFTTSSHSSQLSFLFFFSFA